ncbi:unnamed protein product [Adineta steineri]|uniref:SH3 domain-containing protein n=1 Tax=Adineta steineri TaxID=433720 RepID=A0A819JAK1_9BILA|nr:unnamed protein product [Adineta steineri]CAF3924341.1 unnamed protein product [Adineta steineri]
MAATTAGAASAALLNPIAPPAAEPTAPVISGKTMQQLLSEIDQLKIDVEASSKVLEKIDTGRRKGAANRERSVEGRTKVKDLTERLINLQNQVHATTRAPDSKEPVRTFDKTKQNAVKALNNLSNKLNNVDKHLERATGPMPVTTAPPTDVQPAATPAAPAEENTKGLRSLVSKLPFGNRNKSASKESLAPTTPAVPAPSKPVEETGHETPKTPKDEAIEDDDDVVGESEDEDDDDVVSDKKKEPKQLSPLIKATDSVSSHEKKPIVSNVESDDDEDDSSDEGEDDDEDAVNDNHQLLTELEHRTITDENSKSPVISGRRSQSPATPRSNKKVPPIKIESTPAASPRSKRTTSSSPVPHPSIRKKTPSPRRHPEVPIAKKRVEESDEDSYFEEDEEEGDDDDDEELRRLHNSGDHEDVESDHDYDEQEDEPNIVNAHVQGLRTTKHPPGTQFLVSHDLTSVQTGDLTIHKGEIITLVEQRPDDWWLFRNAQTQQQGVVPINHIQLLSGQLPRRRAKPNTSVTTLVDAFKANNNIPAGFVPSDLAPLTQLEEYQLWRALVPKMTDSNLAFADLYWHADTDHLQINDVTYKKIIVLKQCVKIPKVKGDQIRVLDRCVRVCLYDGFEIISNIHVVRAHIRNKVDDKVLTEDWHFSSNDLNSFVDEQPQLFIRANRSSSGQHLSLLFELSQWCQSTVTQEKCEIACGWSMVPIEDDKPPLITETKGFNELLHGGHTDEPNILLDPQYKILRSDGLSGKIDRLKRARIKFSIEIRDSDIDVLFDSLPIQPVIVSMNILRTIGFFRSELAYQLHKRHHPTGLSTTPIDSIFLSTFFQTLQQPDLIYALRRVYRSRQRRFLKSSSSAQQQRELFIRTYETFIYPLLHYRQLPAYDFHDVPALNERRKLITDMIKRQLPARKTNPQDILSILLDPNLTDKWTPFTTDEICFTLEKYIHDFKTDVVA